MVDLKYVRSLMPMCGTCGSCKLVMWRGEADVKSSRFAWRLPRDPASPPATKSDWALVRCIWLKQAVELPTALIVCEGWKADESTGHQSPKEG